MLTLFMAGVPKHTKLTLSFNDRVKTEQPCTHGKATEAPVSEVLTQWVSLAILVGDGEDSYYSVAVLPQLPVDFLTEHTLTNHCNLHPLTLLCLERRQHTTKKYV